MKLYQHISKPGATAWTGWWRRQDLGRLRFAGADALSFLQALVSNDVAPLQAGQWCDAVYLTPQGRMITDMRVFRREQDVLVAVPAALAASLAARFDLLVFSEDVRVEDVSASVSQISLIGDSYSQIADLFDEQAPAGVPELSPERVESLRIAAGVPRWGVDMGEETIPLEAGLLDRAISQTKGCYVGQEVIVRVLHRGGGRVAKRLMTLDFAAGTNVVPPAGTPILINGGEIGRITSAAMAPDGSRVIALGYVQRDHANPSAPVDVGGWRATLGK